MTRRGTVVSARCKVAIECVQSCHSWPPFVGTGCHSLPANALHEDSVACRHLIHAIVSLLQSQEQALKLGHRLRRPGSSDKLSRFSFRCVGKEPAIELHFLVIARLSQEEFVVDPSRTQ